MEFIEPHSLRMPQRCKVCSAHFQPSDYKETSSRKVLKRHAVPSVFPNIDPSQPSKKVIRISEVGTTYLPRCKNGMISYTLYKISFCSSF